MVFRVVRYADLQESGADFWSTGFVFFVLIVSVFGLLWDLSVREAMRAKSPRGISGHWAAKAFYG